ncbi:MAG: sensor histidine kinase [Candidatus Saccharimonadales bacterium]
MMFNTAYLRLTAWYVVIIMAISILFSAWIYREATVQLREGLERQTIALEEPFAPNANKLHVVRSLADEQLQASRGTLLANLIYLNLFVLGAGAIASFMLAKRTMRPIEEALEAQNRFTADASHELRTPLAAMKTEIEVALRDKNLTKEKAEELLKSNLEEVDRLSALSEALLTLARETDDAAEPVALDEITTATCKRLRSLAEAKNITAKCDIKPVRVKASAFKLEKVIGILIDNAIKYSPKNTTITLATFAKGTHGYVTVRDQGYGVKQSDQAHIFDRFYRADTSRSKERIEGHGLGLAIAKKFIEEMDGNISVVSRPGKGSTFTVKLPLV